MATSLALARNARPQLDATKPRAAAVAPIAPAPSVDWAHLLNASGTRATLKYAANRTVFMQGEPADAVYFLLKGKMQLAVTSQDGKEAIVATLAAGEFFGEGCLAGQPRRIGTALAVGEATLIKVDKVSMSHLIRDEQGLAEVFIAQLLARIVRYEADLVDQIFNSSEKRLARILLLLSHFGKDSKTETVVAGISQEHLAQMVGTTRSRINFFMNRFRKLGYIDYNAEAGLSVHRGLLGVVRSA